MNNKETKEIEDFRGTQKSKISGVLETKGFHEFENKVFKRLEYWKRKLIKLEIKVRKLNNDNNILSNLLNEIKTNQNIKLNNSLKDSELEEEISYLSDYIEFYKDKIPWYKNRIKALEKEVSQQDSEEIKEDVKLEELAKEEQVKEQIKELFVEKVEREQIRSKEKLFVIKKPFKNIFERATFNKSRLLRYGVPVVILLLIISVLFISKPQITGYTIFVQEKTYEDNIGLVINESGNYTWNIDQIGDIKSIKASGKVKGNGTVKVYIEKDGERYLIFDNNKE